MAYVFDGINQALAGKTDEENKQDIFNTPPAVTGDQGQQQPGMPAAGNDMKTSTEGDLTGTNSAANAPTSEQDPQQVQVQNSDVINKNLNKVQAPKGIDRVRSELDTADQGLQNEADTYMKNYQNKDYSLDTGVLDKAVGGDDAAYQQAASRLAQNADRADQFDAKTDYNVEDTNLLRNDAGVQELLRRDSDANYNGGESAFDLMLLRRNKDFNTLRDSLINRQAALTKKGDDLRTSQTDAAQAVIDQRFGDATNNIKSYLDKDQGGIVQSLKDQVAKENAARDALRSTPDQQYLANRKDETIQGLVNEYKQTGDPTALAQLKYIQDTDVDPSQYYGVGRALDADKDYSLGADAATSQKFNRIMALLGKGDSMQAGAGFGDTQGFDTGEYRKAIVASAQGKLAAQQAADAAAQQKAAELAASIKAGEEGKGGIGDGYSGGGNGKGFEGAGVMPKKDTTLAKPPGTVGTGSQPMLPGEAGTVAHAGDQAGKTIDSSAGKPVAKAKGKITSAASKYCFPAGVCFRLADGLHAAIEDLQIGDELEAGGVISHIHHGEADDLFYYNSALVTGSHPVLLPDGTWSLVADAPGALHVPGLFQVYSVTCSAHRMIHGAGTVFGDYEADDILHLARS